MNKSIVIFPLLLTFQLYSMEYDESHQASSDLSNLLSKFDLQIAPPSNPKLNAESIEYASPWDNISLEEMPDLGQFFAGYIPIEILDITSQLLKAERDLDLPNPFILHGPPGVGKSTIAVIMAKMANRKIFYAGGGDFRTKYQGSGSELLNDLFRAAELYDKPCVIIIDEIDGTAQDSSLERNSMEDVRAVKTLITLIGKYKRNSKIYTIGTTNYYERLESAIASRALAFKVDLPDYSAREAIIEYYLSQFHIPRKFHESGIYITPSYVRAMVVYTEKLSGRDIESILKASFRQAKNINFEFIMAMDAFFKYDEPNRWVNENREVTMERIGKQACDFLEEVLIVKVKNRPITIMKNFLKSFLSSDSEDGNDFDEEEAPAGQKSQFTPFLLRNIVNKLKAIHELERKPKPDKDNTALYNTLIRTGVMTAGELGLHVIKKVV